MFKQSTQGNALAGNGIDWTHPAIAEIGNTHGSK
jgi:hypothetical protein